MNATRDALKHKMIEMKMKKHPDGHHDQGDKLGQSLHEEWDEQKSDDDVAGPAPSLKGKDLHQGGHDPEMESHEGLEKEHIDALEKLHEIKPGDSLPEDGDGDSADMKMEILKGLADHGHGGRRAMGLHERAADKVKEKMASIMKHKKQV